MIRFGAGMLISPALILWCSCAAVACDLKNFDRTPPPAIRSSVSNQFARFEWASDADHLPHGSWIWNYLSNTGTAGLGARWKKAKINISKWNPLPAGEVFCYPYLVDAVREKPDTDAPIIYGTNDQHQDAAVYVADVRAAAPTSSIIQTTVIDTLGKKRSIQINLSTRPTDGGFELLLDRASDLIIGISKLPSVLTKSQTESMISDVRKQRSDVEFGTLASFAGLDNANKFVETAFYSTDEAKERLSEPYLFFTGGGGKVITQVNERSLERREADMVVLDKDRRPLFLVGVTLLAPSP